LARGKGTMKNITQYLLVISALLFSVHSQAETLSAFDIIEKMDNRYTGESSRADAKMILIDRRDRERVRDIRMYTLDQGEVEKSISFFLSPADVAGTTY